MKLGIRLHKHAAIMNPYFRLTATLRCWSTTGQLSDESDHSVTDTSTKQVKCRRGVCYVTEDRNTGSKSKGTRRWLRVYSDRTRQRQIDGVKHNALVLEHILVNRSIQTGRVATI